MAVRLEEFETFVCVFGQTPSPVRVLPLIQEREFFLFVIQYVTITPPLEEEVDSKTRF